VTPLDEGSLVITNEDTVQKLFVQEKMYVSIRL
jgi:hypothetical protein